MFDIGFWELAIIGVVALVVIGPERLPAFARTAGLWIGKARRFISNVKEDLDRELKADELRQMIKPGGLEELDRALGDTRNAINEAGADIAEASRSLTGDASVARDPMTDADHGIDSAPSHKPPATDATEK